MKIKVEVERNTNSIGQDCRFLGPRGVSLRVKASASTDRGIGCEYNSEYLFLTMKELAGLLTNKDVFELAKFKIMEDKI